jgi:outer membrane immunogenic protein
LNGNGFLAGGQVGFNHQIGAFVWGLEGDVSWAHIKGHGDFASPYPDYVWHIDNTVNWMSTIRARIGFSAGERLLLYATGGWAFAGVSSHETVTAGPLQGFPTTLVTATASATEKHNGWVAGAGAEYAMGRHWSVKVEYLYADLGRKPYHYVGTAYPLNPTPCAVVAGSPVITTGSGPYGPSSYTCNFAHTTDNFPAKLIVQSVRLGVNYRF